MRVLHLFDRYLNGTMNWAYQLIRHTPGISVEIAAPLIIQNDFYHPAFHYYRSPFQWQQIPDEWTIAPWQQFLSKATFQQLQLYQQSLIRQLKTDPPALLHAHFANVAWLYLKVAKALNRPLVVSFYGYDYERLPFEQPAFVKKYQLLFQQAAHLLAEGPHGAGILERMGCPVEKIRVIPLGIDTEKIPARLRSRADAQLHLVQAATYTEKKGHWYSLLAFHKALANCPNMTLTFVGEVVDRSIFERLKEYVYQHQLQDRVRFLDFVPPGQFHRWLYEFDVFIHPSCYAANKDCEGGAPVVLLDAQATGMPVIATRHCDIPQEVVHMRTGLLADEKDIEQLAQHIEYFYKIPQEEYQKFSRQARKHVEQSFNIEKNCLALAELYETLV